MRPEEVKIAIVTISDSRFAAMIRGERPEDESGDLAESLFRRKGFKKILRILIPNEALVISGIVKFLARREEVDIMVLIGGTGIGPHDVTPEAIEGLLEKRLDGFGELFRRLSYDEIGTRAIASRALAGTYLKSLVFCLPGSVKAVDLALNRIILPEIMHLLRVIRGLPHEAEH
ncbi:MAG: molybdenum cofactor biosynthesis protein [Thermoprotei archaeon]|nr:MAG: molybdenum cofactor biosynthesis protein [Thermoprotei archaeon]RLF25830.1 MAG: molybdenum cofactor biosynthesis protein [Thermoprotei archaeon]